MFFSKEIPFCLEWNRIPGTTKANYKLWIGKNSDVKFELRKNTLVGRAFYRDGFPLEYKIHRSLKLDQDERFACEKLIHRGIVGMLPKLFLEMGQMSIQFTPAFPGYVVEEGPLLFDVDLIMNSLPPCSNR